MVTNAAAAPRLITPSEVDPAERARAARVWLVNFLKERIPANLGAPLATLPRVQEIVGGIEARLSVNARLIDGPAREFDDGAPLSANESDIVKPMVTNNACRGRAVADRQSWPEPGQSAGAASS